MKEVWILGAGFSFPLGAPLFGQVFGEGNRRIARHVTAPEGGSSEQHMMATLRAAALKVYDHGQQPEKGTHLHWRDAEECLRELSDAVRLKHKHPLYTTVLGVAKSEAERIDGRPYHGMHENKLLEDVLRAAKIEMAVEVSRFLMNEDFSGEKWIPYRDWLRTLGPDDTVMTFNYDEAIERLWHTDADLNDGDLQIPTPADSGAARYKPMLLKMHGSTGWYDGSMDRSEWDNPVPQVIRDPLIPPDILIPGPEKMGSPALSGVWTRAEEAIENAEQIHIIGYSFPVTDSFAAKTVLSALAGRGARRAGLIIKTVLGPGYSTDGVRIKATLDGLCETVYNKPMHAQHYLLRTAEAKRTGKRGPF